MAGVRLGRKCGENEVKIIQTTCALFVERLQLQSIGMTGKQLKRMLSFEGLYYAVGTIITSVVLGVLFSVVVVQGISSGIWFFTYQFVMWPMLVIYPFLILLTVAIPALLYRQIAKVSIIERLRQN